MEEEGEKPSKMKGGGFTAPARDEDFGELFFGVNHTVSLPCLIPTRRIEPENR